MWTAQKRLKCLGSPLVRRIQEVSWMKSFSRVKQSSGWVRIVRHSRLVYVIKGSLWGYERPYISVFYYYYYYYYINIAANNYLLCRDTVEYWHPEQSMMPHSLCKCCNPSFSVHCFGNQAWRTCMLVHVRSSPCLQRDEDGDFSHSTVKVRWQSAVRSVHLSHLKHILLDISGS